MDPIDETRYVNQDGTVTQWSIACLIVDNTTVEWDTAMGMARALLTLVTTNKVFGVFNGEGN